MDEKKLDKATEALAKLPKMMEDSIAKGFDRVLGVLTGKAEKIVSQNKQFHEEVLDQDEDTEEDKLRRQKAADEQKVRLDAAARAREMRQNIEHHMKIQNAITGGIMNMNKNLTFTYSKGNLGMQQKFFFYLNQARIRGENFYNQMNEKVKEGFAAMGQATKNTFKGIVQTFTGPFYGMISKIGGVVGPVLGRIFNRPIGMALAAGDLLKRKASDTFGGAFPSFFGNASEAATPLRRPEGERGRAIAVPSAGGSAGGDVLDSHQNMKHYDFYREQFLSISDYLDKILKKVESKGGLAGGIESALGSDAGAGLGAKLFAGLKHFAIGKWGGAAAGRAGLLAGGYETYKTYGQSKEKYGKGLGTANAAARGMISGSLATLGAMFAGAAGAAVGGYLGDKVGGLSNKTGEWLGTHIFDAKELIGKKFDKIGGSIGTSLFDAKELIGKKFNAAGGAIGSTFFDLQTSIQQIFNKVGEGFKGSTAYIKSKIDSFLPSGQTILDVLKNILTSLTMAGTAAVTMVKNATVQVRDVGSRAGKAASEAAGRAASATSSAVKDLFNIGGSRWKAETKGVNSELMTAFKLAAADYKKQTGRTATITEGVRTREQQAALNRGNKYMTAKPGMSMHEKGYALDLNASDARDMERLGILQKYGLKRPYGEKDPVHVELARLASSQKRAEIRAGQSVASTPVIRAPRAAAGAMVNRGGMLEVHAAEIVSPISKFTDMLSRTASKMATPILATQSSMDGEAIGHLAAISSGIGKLVSSSKEDKSQSTYADRASGAQNYPVPDFPGDPGVIFGGNYFPQKGRQW
jgi:hypothetical protein